MAGLTIWFRDGRRGGRTPIRGASIGVAPLLLRPARWGRDTWARTDRDGRVAFILPFGTFRLATNIRGRRHEGVHRVLVPDDDYYLTILPGDLLTAEVPGRGVYAEGWPIIPDDPIV